MVILIITVILGLIFFFTRGNSEKKDYNRLVKEFSKIECELEKNYSLELQKTYDELEKQLDNHPYFKAKEEG